MRLRLTCLLLALSFCLAAPGAAEEPPVALDPATATYRQLIEKADPMDTSGLDRRVAQILDKYYRSNFGGPENWAAIESARFDGRLLLPEGDFRFVAYKKKPDFCKTVIHNRNRKLIMAYDGEDAWQLNEATPDARPISMPPAEARNFIRDAITGSHLLYPKLPGKSIRVGEPVTVDGNRCLLLHVTLSNGLEITYALDLGTFHERQMRTVNEVTGQTEVTTYGEATTIQDIRFPLSSVLTVDGEEVHRVEIRDITLNTGATSWMFQRPSGDFIPDADAAPPSPAPPAPRAPAAADPNWSFSTEPAPSFHDFTRLPDATLDAILQDAGIPPTDPETGPSQ